MGNSKYKKQLVENISKNLRKKFIFLERKLF